jgi:hypothetical protein
VWIDNNLETNTWALIKKGRKRLYFSKILKNYCALTKDLLAFYNSIIRLVLEYGDVLWSGGLTAINNDAISKGFKNEHFV